MFAHYVDLLDRLGSHIFVFDVKRICDGFVSDFLLCKRVSLLLEGLLHLFLAWRKPLRCYRIFLALILFWLRIIVASLCLISNHLKNCVALSAL
jgi:hypothetical protein